MNTAASKCNWAIPALLAALALSAFPAKVQFPDFPPSNVTNIQDRGQMLWQIGI